MRAFFSRNVMVCVDIQFVLMTVIKVTSTVTVVAVCAIVDIPDQHVIQILMNVRLLHLPAKGGARVPTLTVVSTAHAQSRAQVDAMLAVAVPALGEEHAVVIVRTISPANARPGILESVAKIFKASEPTKFIL